jgi:hypothetical protein
MRNPRCGSQVILATKSSRRVAAWSPCGSCQESAEAAARTKGTYFAAQYARIKGRRVHKKAIVAVAHSILVIAYRILKDGQPYNELGAGHFANAAPPTPTARDSSISSSAWGTTSPSRRTPHEPGQVAGVHFRLSAMTADFQVDKRAEGGSHARAVLQERSPRPFRDLPTMADVTVVALLAEPGANKGSPSPIATALTVRN